MQITVRLPVELYEKLKAIAKSRGMSMNAVLVNSIWKMVEEYQ